MGTKLAEKITAGVGAFADVMWCSHSFDEPDCGAGDCNAAEPSVSRCAGENRYVGRTFIMPGQAQRRQSIRRKLNPIPSVFKGKNVLLVDDSIVRGTTIKEILRWLGAGREQGLCLLAAPPVRFPNVYGIDMRRDRS